MSNTQKILDSTSYQDLASMSFGFPTEDEAMELLNNSFSDFGGSGGTNTNRTSVNGAFKPLGNTEVEEGFDFVDDEEFDNFLTKKARERAKRRRELRKEGRDEGKSRKDARRDARRQAVEEIPPSEIFQKIGRGIKVGALALPRASYLSLVRINYRGQAWKLAEVMTNPNNRNKLAKVKDKWNKLGGQWDKLVKNVNIGKSKKPFFCGKKCKLKLAEGNYKKSFVNFNADSDFYNAEPVSSIATATWVSIGSAVLGAMTSTIGIVATSKDKKRELETQEAIAKKELATLSQAEKDKIALAEKQLASANDPIKNILNNPNLSEAEKREAVKLTEEALGTSNKRKIIKYAIMGGLVLVGLLIASKVLKKK